MKHTLTIIVIICSFITHAQEEKKYIDSLLHELQGAHPDTVKVNIFNDLASGYHTVDPFEGIKYGEQALTLAADINWKYGIADAYSTLGLNYQYKSDYPTAIDYYFKALKIFDELGNKKREARLMQNIASVYQYEKMSAKVLEYNMKALKIYEETGDKRGLAATNSNIGIYYFYEGDYRKALEYDFKAAQLNEEANMPSGVGSCLGNVGDAYLHLRDYSRSLEYSFRSLRIFEQLGDKYGIAIDLGNIGEAYLAIARDTAYKIIPDSLVPAGKAANLRKAIDYLEKSISASREIAQLDNIIEFSKYLSEAWELSGNYRAALAAYKQYSQAYDSVYSNENSLKIKQTEHIHELELKDRDLRIATLALQKKRNERAFFIAGICLLLLAFGAVSRNFFSQKKANRLLSFANQRLADEKKRSDDLLRNILPEEVANDLKTTGRAVTKHFEHVTVMFTDFVNFTNAGERMTPEELIEELHTCFKAFDEMIDRYNIEKIKTIGDAYLAVAGLPVSDPLHAEHILRAAIDIMEYMRERKQRMGDKTFDIRIGVHSGDVVAGIVGVKKFAYDIWGDTVNTASRMEEASETGKINVSHSTYELVKDKFTFTYRGEIEAKNKGVLKMYYVVR